MCSSYFACTTSDYSFSNGLGDLAENQSAIDKWDYL
jgi:hypothetical protein